MSRIAASLPPTFRLLLLRVSTLLRFVEQLRFLRVLPRLLFNRDHTQLKQTCTPPLSFFDPFLESHPAIIVLDSITPGRLIVDPVRPIPMADPFPTADDKDFVRAKERQGS